MMVWSGALAVPATAGPAAEPPAGVQADGHGHVHGDGPGLAKQGEVYEGGDIGSAPLSWNPSQYDGKVFTTDAPDLPAQVGLPTVHVIYLHPSDTASRFAEFAAYFQAASREASNRLTNSVGRGIRFDERLGADGVTRYVDITVVKSKSSKRSLESNKQWSLVKNEIDNKFTNANKKYLVFVDAFSSYCGQSQLFQDSKRTNANLNEARTVSTIYRNSVQSYTATTGDFCGGAVLHELSHAFGAVQPSAPHNNSGHCNDWGNDIMCSGAVVPYDATQPRVYDYGNDDYWDPVADPASGSTAKLGWWTVNLSRFVCPATGCDQPNSNPGY